MRKVYFDNAATTPIDEEVIEAMFHLMQHCYGNPSSIHWFGRQARAEIENARKIVANRLNVSPSEIFFTSGGTEADNMAIFSSVRDLGVKHIITSKIEHHAVLHSVKFLTESKQVKLSYVETNDKGHIVIENLEKLLSENDKTLVSLMHANNEIGNLLPIKEVGELCKKYNAIFHCDTVQTVGHYSIDLQKIYIHFITGSAHKFHGPKGVGFLYVNGDVSINPLLHGGAQERNLRAGTENIYGIVGLAMAFDISHQNLLKTQNHIQGLRSYMIEKLKSNIPGIYFNGDTEGSCLYTILNVSFPETKSKEMFLFNLDINGISASSGSACTSGTDIGSHVLKEIESDTSRTSIRFSFSKYNTVEEIDYCIEKLIEICK